MKTTSTKDSFLYRLFFKLPIKSYRGKILFIASIGINIPLLAIFIIGLTNAEVLTASLLPLFLTTLVASLIATISTIYSLKVLLIPIGMMSEKLKQSFYENEPSLTTESARNQGEATAGNTVIYFNQFDDKIEEITYYDSVTSLPNRALLKVHIQQGCQQSQIGKNKMVLLHLTVDNFQQLRNTLKLGNDKLLLQHCAENVLECLSVNDEAFHFGDGNFALLLRDLNSPERSIALAKEVLAKLSLPFLIENENVILTSSVGITVFPDDGREAEKLLKNADVAVMEARQKGGNTYQFYRPEIQAKLRDRIKIESQLHKALEREEMLLYYQPKIELKTNRIVAVEALIRWEHPELGLVSPGKFIPIAEESDLICDLGSWTLQEACQQNKKWQDAELSPITVAVNLSARQFRQSNLVALVEKILGQTNLEGQWLDLEVTESLLLDNMEESIATLNHLREMNVGIDLDDFGTGYSSFSYLRTLPLSSLKIDRSFVKAGTALDKNAAIVEAIIASAHKLNLVAIAEGIETIEQLNFIKTCGCDIGQGYYWSRPLPSEEITEQLRQQNAIA